MHCWAKRNYFLRPSLNFDIVCQKNFKVVQKVDLLFFKALVLKYSYRKLVSQVKQMYGIGLFAFIVLLYYSFQTVKTHLWKVKFRKHKNCKNCKCMQLKKVHIWEWSTRTMASFCRKFAQHCVILTMSSRFKIIHS